VDAVGIDAPFFGAGLDETEGSVAVEDTGVVVILGLKAVGKNEGDGAPIIKTFGDFDTFDAVHEHDVGAAGSDDDGRAVAFVGRRQKDSKEWRIEGGVAHRQRHFACLPKGDVEVGDFGFERESC